MPEGLRVLDAIAGRFGLRFKYHHYDWNCERYKKTGRMMPEDGIRQLTDSDAVVLGAVGTREVPDYISLWDLLIPIRREFDQYVNLRPVRLLRNVPVPLGE